MVGDDGDRLSLSSYRTSIQNSPDWPSVKSLPLCLPTLNSNGPDDEQDDENDLSLANFSYADSLDRSSVITADTLTLSIDSRPSTPRASQHTYSNSLELDVHGSPHSHTDRKQQQEPGMATGEDRAHENTLPSTGVMIFGRPLKESLKHAKVQTSDAGGNLGYIPVVIAKWCVPIVIPFFFIIISRVAVLMSILLGPVSCSGKCSGVFLRENCECEAFRVDAVTVVDLCLLDFPTVRRPKSRARLARMVPTNAHSSSKQSSKLHPR